MNKGNTIERYEPADRINHWLVAIAFVLLALSGLALFHPAMFFLTNLFGGGPWTRILHPFIGLVMFVAFIGLALRFWRHNVLDKNDEQWLKQWQDVINNREDKLPEVGRYNAGQKVLFWVMVACLIVLLLTGFVIWRPYFAPAFNITVVRIAVLFHAIAAFVLILGIIVHVYAAIWVKGSVRAMTRGYVTRAWAKKHHAAWYRQLTSGSGPK
jgi:formate dehydrogenase subunit gamma